MPALPLSRIRIAADAKASVETALARVNTADRKKVEQALVRAATQNADRYLNAAEVKAVLDAFDQVSPDATVKLSGESLGLALDLAHAAAGSMESLSNVDGVSAHFSFQESLEAKLISELKDTVAAAKGRPTEINMMIFQFQSDEVEQAIVDLAKNHPNVTFRIIGDSGQASSSRGNALPSILDHKLPNVQVKYKTDFPYTWSDSKKKAVYNHGASSGLNHHKGFVSVIEGRVDRVVTGSFNWSDTADEKNYEDLVAIRAMDASTRRAGEQYLDEFAGFFNGGAALSPNAFWNWRGEKMNALAEANGVPPSPFTPKPDDSYPAYQPTQDARSIDVNGFRLQDKSRLDALVGRKLAGNIRAERSRHGRFASFEELMARVPQLAGLDADKRATLERDLFFGSHTVSINNATLAELDQAGFSKSMAKAIVDYRAQHGDFESVDELANVPGMAASRMAFAKKYLVDDDVEAFFNSRPFGAPKGGTGYGADSSNRKTPVMNADGQVESAPASVTVAATDLMFRAKPGDTIDVAMYGMSTTAPEFLALVGAARRGIPVRVILNDAYTERTVNALVALRDQGLPIDVRVQTAKTMHEKFGVVGNDVFFGSANFSESSSTKHSEDRFAIKNHDEVSTAFKSQFEALWAKSRIQ